uniref:PDZ domain-containing protein n=1 Tax=Globisporangium ultimum (strain ATCC 200006 / CBS 805.95 / DAOM BR144) TaxID=431595 RepID=K3WG70_GLOUD
MEAVGLDEFGREHFVVEAAPGRLCMSLAENDQGFIVVCGFDSLASGDWDEVDLKRMRVLHQTVSIGDRLVAIEGEDVVHCSLREVSARLGKLAAKKRLLTFARYHPSHYDRKKYDVEKLVLVRAPPGPLGLLISETVNYRAMIDGFQKLPDGSTGKLEQHSKIHRGCQLIHVNGVDVSSLPREEVITVLSNMRDREKEIVLYRAAPNSCEIFVKAEHATADIPLGFCFDDNENFKYVVVSTITPAIKASLLPGDILIGVNATDVSCLNRRDAIAVVNAASFPRTLYFYRSREEVLPECHLIRLESGPFGLNLDSARPRHAVISGFTTPADAGRPVFKHCASFLPGSFIISINKVNVAHCTLADISGFLSKLKHSQKDIIVCNAPLVEALKKQRSLEVICVPKGPLGIHFDGARQDCARISGFYAMPDGQSGAIEASQRIPIGAFLRSINKMNVSCLALAQVTDLLKNLSDVPKELVFYLQNDVQDANAKVINVHVPPGPLGIDLKNSISNKVIVDRLNQDQSTGATRIFDHGGVISGSEIIAIDNFDVTSLELLEVTQLLRMMASHEKMITFSTTSEVYTHMLSNTRGRTLRSVVVTRSPLGIEFDSHFPQKAVVSGYSPASDTAPPCELREEDISTGSRLVALDNVDIRELSLHDIAKLLRDFAGISKTLVFETGNPSSPAPRSPHKVAGLHIEASGSELSQGTTAPLASSPLLQRSVTQGFPTRSVTFAGSPPFSSQQAPQMSVASTTALPPAPLQLAPLSIKPLEALKSMSLTESTKTTSEQQKQQQENPPKTEYLINMLSWTGSRSLCSMVVDLPNAALKITSAKPTSPRGAGKPGVTNVVPFNDITAVEFGKKDDEGNGAPIVATTGGKKSADIDMRSRDERNEFHGLLLASMPSLRQLQ